MGLRSLATMEWKNLRNTSLAMECKKLAIITRGKRTTMVASVFIFTLLACTAYLAFYSPGKIVTNPMGRTQTWFPSFLSGSNSSQPVSVFSFIFPHSDSASSATLDDQGGALKNIGDPHNLTANAPDGRRHIPGEGSLQVNTGGNVAKSRGKGKKKRRGSAQNNTLPVKGQTNPNLAPAPVTAFTEEQANPNLAPAPALAFTVEQTNPNLAPAPAIAFTEEQANPNLAPAPGVAYRGGRENATNGTYIGDVKVANNGESPSPNGKNGNASAARQGAGSMPGRIEQCDIFSGRWVQDDSYPYYPAGSCPHLDESFDCFRNKRPDNKYEKWRWQPNECGIPRLNATDMLERLRGKRLVFVGDSLNRNMWESLVCILRHSVQDKERVYEISGRHDFKTDGFYAFRYEDYNCSVEFLRSPFLVQEWEVPGGNGTVKETLRLDVIEGSAYKYRNADVIVFNTGHWWTHEKTSQGLDYYQEGNRVYSKLNVVEAYRKALRTWAKWVDRNINPKKTQVFFRGYSASHFRGGPWNSGGQCHTESEPIFNESYLLRYPPKMSVLESVLQEMKTPVTYLNITRMTDYRKDGHPSVYRKQYMTQEERMAPERFQDCSHWCLPGVPDTWNELLYASLLMRGKGAWAT